jgi:transposase
MSDLKPIVKRSAGLDVHKKIVVATMILEQADGTIVEETKEFGTFPNQRKHLAKWLQEHEVELVIMESTGVYWKSIYAALEELKLNAYVVNARHVKNVPGRKTDVKDSQWLATLARYGLVRNSFIPPVELRELRLIARYRTKVVGMISSEKNRLHKLLDDAGIHLGNIVSDINGVTATNIIKGLIAGKSTSELLGSIRGRLKTKSPEFKEALECKLSSAHVLVLKEIQEDIDELSQRIQRLDSELFSAMESSYKQYWQLLQTIPGINAVGAALLIIETGVDMNQFKSMKHFCSWAGLCPGNNESAGKRSSGRTRKGNRQLRHVICELANGAVKTNSQLKSKYKSLVIRRGHKKAIIAIGHKMMRIIYTVLLNESAYKDPGIDYEKLVVEKNAPRWIKALNTYGYLTT